MRFEALVALVALAAAAAPAARGYGVNKFSFLMPNVRPTVPELYLCTPVKVDPMRPYYIVGFEPNATMATAHHMLLYGCSEPGSAKPVWNCGEMAAASDEAGYEASSPCKQGTGSEIVYAWARDAPTLSLPEDVGFKVGGDSDIKYLVLQVHYAHIDKFKDGSTDDSGIFLHYTQRPLPRLAGVVLLGTGGRIAPHAEEHMETSCEMREHKVVHPFAYRTHTHALGKVVSGYRVRSDRHGEDHWTLLGKRDPLTPQMFYPVLNNVTIQYGDKLAARCTMESTRDDYTMIGATNKDEMCNFYLMYWVEGTKPLDVKYCFTEGPPRYHWDSAHFNHIPDEEASAI
ncbi:peptidylglycine alpha-hydroxylating monooxygenase [Frankliniella occidentalis]|uniref:peptidylglycine monooxygenase n=1 Tax=Frankliniella occidentalis TaxID=133901 RepID=A0A6J1TRK9_FRAOC|nr:peptidylglycine alpha-hydroxylating monooxygenase [Frankliniella occidentalis]